MYILGIESSCDETSISIIEFSKKIDDNNFKVLTNIVSSQIDIHKKFGGVVPEIASREHIKNIGYVLDSALEEANLKLSDIDVIAVTVGPGLVGALLVGVSFAKALSYSLNIPLIPVHHIAGHIAANYLSNDNLRPPFISLVVSGGHSHIIEVKDYTNFKILAKTRDDAVGEAFDKVARILGLGYPGGPEVSKRAKMGQSTYKLPKTEFDDSFDFSFSGIKTAVLNTKNKEKDKIRINDMCASFESAVSEVLVDHVIKLAKEKNINKIALAGGVSANTKLRELLSKEGRINNIDIFLPDFKYCTDNAAMIALYGIFKFREGKYFNNLSLNAKASMNIEEE